MRQATTPEISLQSRNEVFPERYKLGLFKSSIEIQSQLLAKYSTYTIQEEWNVSNAMQLCSEAFYLRVQ